MIPAHKAMYEVNVDTSSSPYKIGFNLYWPKAESPSILPPGEGTWSPAPLVKAH